MAKLIVFDLDGTLIDSRHDLAGAVNSMRASMGLEPLEIPRIVHFIGNGINSLVRRSIADAEVDFDEALRRMKNFYADHLLDCTALYPGVATGLRELHADGVKLAVLSNKSTDPIRKILEGLKIDACFDDVIGGDADYPLKPAPDALIALREKYAFPPDACWMVGDHYTDLEAGRRAGFRRILVTYGFGDPGEEKPDYQVDSFGEFVAVVKRF